MNRLIYFVWLTFVILSLGCGIQRESKFSSSYINPGMTKGEIISKYGKPYKESSSIDSNNTLHEKLYYKEQLYMKRWYEVNSILNFENSVFKSLEQGKEQPLYKDSQVIVK
jgi:hypothetical protein